MKFYLSFLLSFAFFVGFAQNTENAFMFCPKESEAAYQEYVGQKIQFREPIGSLEKQAKINASIGVNYAISAIVAKPYKDDNLEVLIEFTEENTGNRVNVVAYNKDIKKKNLLVENIPVIFIDKFNEAKAENVGKEFESPEDMKTYKILDMSIGSINNKGYSIARTRYKVEERKSGLTSFMSASFINRVISGEYVYVSDGALLDARAINGDLSDINFYKKDISLEWASNIKKMKNVDEDGNIKYQYVIPINSEDEKVLSKIISIMEVWFSSGNFPEFRILTRSVDYNEPVKTMEGSVHLGIVAKKLKYVTPNHFEKVMENYQSMANVMIEFKENRLRITIVAKDFHISYTHTGIDKIPAEYGPDVKEEVAINNYAMNNDNANNAFVNTNLKCVETAKEIVEYINSRYKAGLEREEKEKKRIEEEW